jgi:hypothetical protein
MSYYRAYYIKEDRIVAPDIIEADGDAQAMLKASDLLEKSQSTSMEAWQGFRLVGASSKPDTPSS